MAVVQPVAGQQGQWIRPGARRCAGLLKWAGASRVAPLGRLVLFAQSAAGSAYSRLQARGRKVSAWETRPGGLDLTQFPGFFNYFERLKLTPPTLLTESIALSP